MGPLDHGLCESIYFAGPENLSLELSCSLEPIDAQAWIDPEVVELAGISADELARYKAPADFADAGGALQNPGPDAEGPHMTNYPPGVWEAIIATPASHVPASESEPPVRIERQARAAANKVDSHSSPGARSPTRLRPARNLTRTNRQASESFHYFFGCPRVHRAGPRPALMSPGPESRRLRGRMDSPAATSQPNLSRNETISSCAAGARFVAR